MLQSETPGRKRPSANGGWQARDRLLLVPRALFRSVLFAFDDIWYAWARDRRDSEIASVRLSEIKANPGLLVTGDRLKKALAALSGD